MSGFSGKKPPSRGSEKLSDLLPIYAWKDNDNKNVSFRPFGTVISYEFAWFWIVTPKGKVKIPKLITDLDPWTDEYVADEDPFRHDGRGEISRLYLVNAISRVKQASEPKSLPALTKNESKFVASDYFEPYKPFNFDGNMRFVKMGTNAWTPWVPLSLSPSSVRQITEGAKDNIVDGESFDATHPEFGFDIQFKYNSKGTGTGKMIVTADPTESKNQNPITDEELEFPVWELDVLKYPKLSDHKADYREFKEKITDAPKEAEKGGSTARGRLEEDEAEDDVRSNTSRRNARGNIDKLSRRRVEESDDDIPS